jgi:hypothetical protein
VSIAATAHIALNSSGDKASANAALTIMDATKKLFLITSVIRDLQICNTNPTGFRQICC